MPMSPTEMERKVLQLDNDVSAIYTMIADIQNTQGRHTNRFEEMGARLDQLIDRQTAIEGGLEGVEGRLEGVEGRLERVEGRLERVEGQLGEILTLLRDRG